MLERYNKAPFLWYGGKSKAAPLVWQLLGDVPHYVEPFAGALGVLLERPHPCNRPYFSETINDLDGFVVNAWRAIQWVSRRRVIGYGPRRIACRLRRWRSSIYLWRP